MAAPLTGATMRGHDVYLVTRGLHPAVIARYDLTTGKITQHAELSTGTGGWAATVSGGDVYAGMYGVADIHRYDPDTNTTTRVGRLGNETYAWQLATAPDGTMYAGTYPNGKLFSIDPADGAIKDLGVVSPGDQYVRSVAVAPDGTMYAGAGTAARLVEYDPVTQTKREILPTSVQSESFVYSLAVTDDLVAAGTEPSGKLVLINRHDPSQSTIVDTGDRNVDQILIDGDDVYLTGRTSGAVYDYSIGQGKLTRLGVPLIGDETRRLFRHGNSLVGASGAIWTLDLDTHAIEVDDLVQAGMPAAPEPAQSVSVQDHRFAYVGGNFGLQVQDLARGTSTRVRVYGEAKQSLPVGPTLYTATYPGAFVDTYDPRTETVARVAAIGGIQDRPRALEYLAARQQLAIGSRSEYGHNGGAFSLYDLRTKKLQRFDDPIPGQGITAIAARDSVAYLGSEIRALGVPPVAKQAEVDAFGLDSHEVLWRWVPVPGQEVIDDLLLYGGRLYGITNRGTVFVGDVDTHTTIATYQISDHTGGDLFLRHGQVWGGTGNVVFRLDSTGPTELVTGLHGNWYNDPQVWYDEVTDDVYTVRGTDLVRIHLAALS